METDKVITLVLADEHGIVREGIAALCSPRPELRIAGQCSDGAQAVDLILALQPDFAVLDLNLPTVSGLEVIRRLRVAKSETRILVLSTNRDEHAVREAFYCGASGYLLKDGPADHLLDAIHSVLAGEEYLTPLIRREAGDKPGEQEDDRVSLLSKRELQIFSLLVEGVRPRDIARRLDVSPKTVDTHRSNILRKLEVDGVAALVRFAIERNLISKTLPD
jgi:DNA-binding NarL/FixJ family response regulator